MPLHREGKSNSTYLVNINILSLVLRESPIKISKLLLNDKKNFFLTEFRSAATFSKYLNNLDNWKPDTLWCL